LPSEPSVRVQKPAYSPLDPRATMRYEIYMKYVLMMLLMGFAFGQQRAPRQPSRNQVNIPKTTPGADVAVEFAGTTSSITSKKLTLAKDDSAKGEENSLDFELSKKTLILDGDKKLKSSDVKNGQAVTVEAKRQIDGTLEAVTIRLQH
jgi:hypothetical protein